MRDRGKDEEGERYVRGEEKRGQHEREREREKEGKKRRKEFGTRRATGRNE